MAAMQRLPAELTIYVASSLRTEFQQWLAKPTKTKRGKAKTDAAFEVDASGVLEIDGAGAQLLVALSHSLAASGRKLRLLDASHTLTSACETLGLTTLLTVDSLVADLP